jgi:hypothetical protein
MKKSLFTTLLIVFGIQHISGQTIAYKIYKNEPETMPNLQVRAYPEFFIAPGDVPLALPVNLVVDVRYWAGNLADVRAGVSFGTNLGLHFGGTYHLKDRVKPVYDRFKLSETQRGNFITIKSLKVLIDAKKISGPCADVFVGRQFGRFTSKIDIGWEWQSFQRASIDVDGRIIQGNFNGFLSIKAQGVVQVPIETSKQITEPVDGYFKVYDRKKTTVGFGGQIDATYSFRPWKFSTLFTGLALGYIRVPNDGSAPILSIKIGASFNGNAKLFNLNTK